MSRRCAHSTPRSSSCSSFASRRRSNARAPGCHPCLQVNILRELRHPFIVRYYDRIIDKASTKIYIVMECCEGGDLGNVVKACKKDGCVDTRRPCLLQDCLGRRTPAPAWRA